MITLGELSELRHLGGNDLLTSGGVKKLPRALPNCEIHH